MTNHQVHQKIADTLNNLRGGRRQVLITDEQVREWTQMEPWQGLGPLSGTPYGLEVNPDAFPSHHYFCPPQDDWDVVTAAEVAEGMRS